MLVKMSEMEELESLTQAFRKIDKDGSGLITQDELQELFVHKKIELTKEEITRIF